MAGSKSDYLNRTKRQYFGILFLTLLASNLLLVAGWVVLSQHHNFSNQDYAVGLSLAGLILSLLFSLMLTRYLVSPIKAFWQLVLHITPNSNQPAPNVDSLKIGRELLANLAMQVYQLTTSANSKNQAANQSMDMANYNFIANNLPLPLFILDKDESIVLANKNAS